LIVKPPREGSSLGMTRVTQAQHIEQAAELATRYDPDLLCEEFIEGAELTCPVLGAGENAHALPVIRIEAPNGEYDFKNKYTGNAVKYHCPSGLPVELEKQVQTLVVQAYRALGCRGWARADIMLRARDNQPFLLEMNTSPGMTDHSLVPMSARSAGISYEELCLRLLQSATLDYPNRGA
jgi:D-alanine-D-alanine ligase